MLLSIRMGSDVKADLSPVDECIAAVRMNRAAQDVINSGGYFVFTVSAIYCKAVVKNEVWNRTNACRSGVRRFLLNLLSTGLVE